MHRQELRIKVLKQGITPGSEARSLAIPSSGCNPDFSGKRNGEVAQMWHFDHFSRRLSMLFQAGIGLNGKESIKGV